MATPVSVQLRSKLGLKILSDPPHQIFWYPAYEGMMIAPAYEKKKKKWILCHKVLVGGMVLTAILAANATISTKFLGNSLSFGLRA